MTTRCPFCGRGIFDKKFVNLQLAGLYKSASITSMQNYAMQKAAEKLEAQIRDLKKKNVRVSKIAIRRTLQSVCDLLKHYELKPNP